MKNFVLGLGIAASCSAGIAAADNHVPVTITGCLHAGTGSGEFVLTDVEQVTGATTAPVDVIYWLSTTRGLKQRAGQKIEVSGTYSPSRDAGKTGKIIVKTNLENGEQKVAVENGAKKAEMKSETGAVATSGEKTEAEKPYRRLEVQSIKTIAPNCL